MGLFDLIVKNAQKTLNEKIDGFNKKVEAVQNKITTTPLDTHIKEAAAKPMPPKKTQKQSLVAKQIINLFYADYPETPYISNDRKADWIESARTFPKQCIIPKSIMKRYSDELLPGHVYMLYWLKKYTNKKVPSYFEYKYGIDFEKEKMFLHEKGFLDDLNKPTAKGEAGIKRHYKVIENHAPKPDRSTEGISKQILAQRNSFIKDGISEYKFIANSDCCEICAQLNGKHFPISQLKIGVNAPPMYEGCKCSIAAYVDGAEYEEWLNFINKGGTTKQWEAMKKKR